jgi:RNA polymerase sigma-70 factor (ECF subfamily)
MFKLSGLAFLGRQYLFQKKQGTFSSFNRQVIRGRGNRVDFDYLKNITGGLDRNVLLDEIMMAYGKDVWNYAYFLLRRKDLAEDIAQDVFVKAYNNLYNFRGDSSMKSWLLTITRNTALDYFKSAWVRRVQLFPLLSGHGTSPSAENEWFGFQEQDHVWRTVMSLSRKLRETLLLYAHHRMTILEIANLLGLSEGTVKSRLHRARTEMNRRMRNSNEKPAFDGGITHE